MIKIRKLVLLIAIVVFIVFLVMWLSARSTKYDMDWWYYAGNHGVYPGANFGPPNGVVPGLLGQGHDLALIISRLLVQIGNFALPAFFISFFCFTGYFMLKPLCRFPESIFLAAPFSLVLLIMSGAYFLFAQMLSMSFFFISIGFYLREPAKRNKLATTICLALMATSHTWSSIFYLGAFGLYLLVKDRKFILYLLPAIAILLVLMPGGVFNFLSDKTSVGSNLSYLWNVQLTENLILIPFLFYGAWRLCRKPKIGLLFAIVIVAPLVTIMLLWSPYWSYRVVTLIPILLCEAAGVSVLLEYIARRGGV